MTKLQASAARRSMKLPGIYWYRGWKWVTLQAGSIVEVCSKWLVQKYSKSCFSLVCSWSEICFHSESQDQRLKIFISSSDDFARTSILSSLKLSKDLDLKWSKGWFSLFQSIPGRCQTRSWPQIALPMRETSLIRDHSKSEWWFSCGMLPNMDLNWGLDLDIGRYISTMIWPDICSSNHVNHGRFLVGWIASL